MCVRIPHQERAWIYDIDPDPLLNTFPVRFRDLLTESLAKYLQDSVTSSIRHHPLLAGQSATRPNLFLRRMLRILFEFEHSKYR